MFRRVTSTEKPKTKLEYYPEADMRAVLEFVSSNPSFSNPSPSVYHFIEAYKEKGVDLQNLFDKGPHTAYGETITRDFLSNREHGVEASLAESLPFFANQKGMLGDFFEVNVTKTLKQDDQGGSFIDFVLELKNTWIENGAPKELQDVPAKMTFLIDITSAGESEKYGKKVAALRDVFLLYGQKAKVLCYENQYRDLGIERPKLLVKQAPNYLREIGGKLGECITQSASDKFTINRPHEFQEAYRDYFMDLMDAISENAQANIEYLRHLSQDNSKRLQLMKEYIKIVNFVAVYKKTPITKK